MKSKKLLLTATFTILFSSFAVTGASFADAAWTDTSPTIFAGREDPTSTLLQDGKVLITGGRRPLPTRKVELYDQVTGTWLGWVPLLEARDNHTATLLNDGRVLVVGGAGTTGILDTAEIYNPVTFTWQNTNTQMNSKRLGHTATLLNDGKVLIVGGHNNSPVPSVEVYHPSNNAWILKASLPQGRQYHTATLLPDGRIFVIGGQLVNGYATNATVFYDPSIDIWQPGPDLTYARSEHTSTLLKDGTVLTVGGGNPEIWSPATNQWIVTSPMSICRTHHSATLLNDGRVLVAGGYCGEILNSAEIYDPTTGEWRLTDSMNTARYDHIAVLLPNGTVLVATGRSNDPLYTRTSETYTPSTPTPTPLPKTPLVLIPGIAGSEFKSDQTFTSQIKDCGILPPFTYTIDHVVWLDILKTASSFCDDYVDVLKLNPDGQTPQYPQIVLNGTFVSLAYGGFIDFFTDNGYELNKTLFLFPYDWRKDIPLTKLLLDQKIESIKQQTGSKKVDIVTHSMGGLVARNYIADSGKAEKVRKLFTLATPHLGSTEYIKNLMYGGCLSVDPFKKPICFGISPSEIKDVIQNMIGGFELAPSQTYFDLYSGEDNLHPFPFRDDRDMDSNNVTGALNYSQIKDLLTNLGHNTALFTPSEAFHALDENLTDTNGVEVSIIAGSGKTTLGQIIEKYRVNFKGIKIPQRDKITVNGDETVPLLSASLIDLHKNLSLLGSASLYYTNQEHGALVANGPALNLVKNILNDGSTLPNDVSREPYKLKGHQLSVHSPVELHIYDQHGNHTGETIDGDFEANIPDSSYDTLDDAKFIWLPDDGIYNIKFDATGEGSFDFKIRKFENDTNINTIIYKEIPLTLNTHAMTILDTTQSQLPILEVDQDNNGVIDFEVDPTSQVFGDATYDQTPPTTNIILNGTKGNSDWFINNVNVSFDPIDDNSSVSKTEYSLDNGETIQKYNGPFTLSRDGVYKIKAKSTDKAGNEETPQEIEIKIDRTPPEAKIFIDHSLLDLVVEGTDTNQATVKRLDNIYTITDLAGNSLKLDVLYKDLKIKNNLRIRSLQYNQDMPIDQPSNRYSVSYKGKRKALSVKEQKFELKGEVKIRIKYDFSKNQSTVITKENGKEKIKEIRPGLVLLQLLTENGKIKYNY